MERLTPGLVAESAAMKDVLAAARRVAATDAGVLLLGESGTGKNQLARLIHYSSKRAAAPLVEVHCAALPDAAKESASEPEAVTPEAAKEEAPEPQPAEEAASR